MNEPIKQKGHVTAKGHVTTKGGRKLKPWGWVTVGQFSYLHIKFPFRYTSSVELFVESYDINVAEVKNLKDLF